MLRRLKRSEAQVYRAVKAAAESRLKFDQGKFRCSLADLIKATELSRATVKRAVRGLRSKGVIVVNSDPGRVSWYEPQMLEAA